MRTEIRMMAVVLVAIVFRLLHWPFSGLLLILSLSLLSILYLPGAFYFFCDKKLHRQNYALSIIAGTFLSPVPIGILFKLQHWPNAQFFLAVGIVAALSIMVISIYLRSKAPEELDMYHRNMIIRSAVLAAFAISAYMLSVEEQMHLNDSPLSVMIGARVPALNCN